MPSLKATCDGVFCEDRNLLITDLADSEYQLARELASVRHLLHLALQELHERGRQYDRLRDQHRRLSDEYRSYRVRVLRDDQRAVA